MSTLLTTPGTWPLIGTKALDANDGSGAFAAQQIAALSTVSMNSYWVSE